MRRRSTILGGATQVHARAVPWGLAERRVSAIQSRYILSTKTVVVAHEHSAGARACLGRRCELLQCKGEQSPHNFHTGSSKPRG